MATVITGPVTLLPSRRSFRLRHHPAVAVPLRFAVMTAHGLNNLLTVVALVAFLGLAVGPHLFGYRTQTMLTGSMVPQINPGDVEVVTELPATELNVGDVISYHIPVDDHRVVSHRVISVTTNADGTTSVQTKGDANNGPDPWTASFNDGGSVYQVRMVVPKIGHVIRLLRTPELHRALQFGAPVLVCLILISAIWRRPAASTA